MKAVPYEGYVTYDMKGSNGWVRMFCVQMPDKSCGILLAQHHTQDTSPVFDHATEINLGIVCAGSVDHALQMINQGTAEGNFNPAIIRRLARLMTHGSLMDHFVDTMTERGVERMVVYGSKMTHASYSIFDRAGFRQETRGETECRVLDVTWQ